MLYEYDPEKQQLTMNRTPCSLQAAAEALRTTRYKLKQMIEVFTLHGVLGVSKMQHGAGRRPKFLNITP